MGDLLHFSGYKCTKVATPPTKHPTNIVAAGCPSCRENCYGCTNCPKCTGNCNECNNCLKCTVNCGHQTSDYDYDYDYDYDDNNYKNQYDDDNLTRSCTNCPECEANCEGCQNSPTC